MARDPGLDLPEHRNGRTNLAGGAITALIAVVLHESGLHGMKALRCAQPLDRRNASTLVHHGQGEARVDPAPFDDHRAGPALTVVAPLLGARELQVLSQCIEQRRPRVELEGASLAVHGEGHLRHHGQPEGRRGCFRLGLDGRRSCSRRNGANDQQLAPGYFEVGGLIHGVHQSLHC
jgi:hypothetical protein